MGTIYKLAGGTVEFTVEVWKTSQDGTFKHWKAGLLNSKSDSKRTIFISGSEVYTRSSQVLDINIVKHLFEAFMDGYKKLSYTLGRFDMTQMFL